MGRSSRRVSSHRAAPARGPAYGGQSFREPPIYRRNRPVGRLVERPGAAERWAPADEPVWAVRVEIRSLTGPEAPPLPRAPAPAELVQALEGAREIRAVGVGSGWRLIRDGEFIGTVSRPAEVHIAEILPPESAFVAAYADPLVPPSGAP